MPSSQNLLVHKLHSTAVGLADDHCIDHFSTALQWPAKQMNAYTKSFRMWLARDHVRTACGDMLGVSHAHWEGQGVHCIKLNLLKTNNYEVTCALASSSLRSCIIFVMEDSSDC